MILVKLRVSWGGSPETDDSAVTYVTITSQRIVAIHHWRLTGWIRWMFMGGRKEYVYLGHGYTRRDEFDRILMRLSPVPLSKLP
jgi:hypothetical protein